MLKSGILNPHVNSLLSRVRHTNTLVVADRGFPFWPQIETIDLAVVDNIPRVLDVLGAVLLTFNVGRVYLASEFFENNGQEAIEALHKMLCGVELVKEPHLVFKQRVPFATGLIRTADTNPYSNIILESA
jgi:D-ribose pyranase